MTWPYEDGGPRRLQTVAGGLHIGPGSKLEVTSRFAPAVTMVAGRGDGGLYLLRHTAGDSAVAIVERIDPLTLEPLAVSPELPGGPVWPGGLGVHDDGTIHVVFGNHAHRLDAELRVLASRTLPRERPYNSFVPLPDGHLVTKDFGGSRPGLAVAPEDREPCELVVLEPDGLAIVATLVMPEPSIARLSAAGGFVYVVGDTSLLRASWDGTELRYDEAFGPRYRTLEGQTYGWDCVLMPGAVWLLDNGDGSERFTGNLRGHGVSTTPLHLVRISLLTTEVTMAEICGLPGGLVANPPVIDQQRGIAVGYDSGNGVVTAFSTDTLAVQWSRQQGHASHMLLYAETGELVMGDDTDVVIIDITTGTELARADTGSPMQSVLFPAPGLDRDFYLCSFPTVSRVAVTG